MQGKIKYSRHLFFFSSVIFSCFSLSSQREAFFDSLLSSDPKLTNVLSHGTKYKLSIYYTRIDRDQNNEPHFTTFSKVAKSSEDYFYPASTVKLPVSLAAMARLEDLQGKGISRETTMVSDSALSCQKKVISDESSNSKKPSVGNYIKRMFLVSDNIACARTYDFIGCDYLHASLERWSFGDIRINNKLEVACPGDTAKVCPPVYFLSGEGDTLYRQPLIFSAFNKKHPIKSSKVGQSSVNSKGRKTGEAKDFAKHNYFDISDLHAMMRRLVFNNQIPVEERLPLSNDSRLFLLKYLGMYPRESEDPKYDPKIYYDSFKKYFMYGSSVATIKGDSIRIFNIVGRAYGFLIDCAYIVDFKNNVELLLTAGLYVNERNSFGSGKYEYDTIGLPFLRNLSKTVYSYERSRLKQHPPDLSEFNLFGYH